MNQILFIFFINPVDDTICANGARLTSAVCDCLISEAREIYKKQQHKQESFLGATGIM